MARLSGGRNTKFTYGTQATFSFQPQALPSQYNNPIGAFSQNFQNSSSPTAGTLIIAGTTVTLTAADILTNQGIIARIAATAITGYTVRVETDQSTVTLISATVGPTTAPTVSLGTATNILFNNQIFTNGLAVPSGNLDDIKISGRTPVSVTLVNTGGSPSVQTAYGTDAEQAAGTLTYTNLTLSAGAATITVPTDYIRVVAGGATQAILYINR